MSNSPSTGKPDVGIVPATNPPTRQRQPLVHERPAHLLVRSIRRPQQQRRRRPGAHGGAHQPAMAPVTQARWSALPPRLRLPAPAAADGVAATSFSRNCNVTELVVSYLSPCSSIVLFVFDGVAYEWIRIQI